MEGLVTSSTDNKRARRFSQVRRANTHLEVFICDDIKGKKKGERGIDELSENQGPYLLEG